MIKGEGNGSVAQIHLDVLYQDGTRTQHNSLSFRHRSVQHERGGSISSWEHKCLTVALDASQQIKSFTVFVIVYKETQGDRGRGVKSPVTFGQGVLPGERRAIP